jgi:hypothetical protein
MLLLVMRETNRKLRHINHDMCKKFPSFNEKEIMAAIAILLRESVDRDNYYSLERLWHPQDSRPFYRAAMGIRRFKMFLRCVRFDNIHTRNQRTETDCLAAIRDI